MSGWIRLGVPNPELSILLIDWSSLLYVGQRCRCCLYDDIDDSDMYGIVQISHIAAPVFLSLLMGKWGSARRLVFGQVLVAGQRNVDVRKNGVMIHRCNDRAMGVG